MTDPEPPDDPRHARVDPALAAWLGEALCARERIDTHAASVFLAPGRAYKLKRPVALGYLDFSTPDRRRAALKRELELNAEHAPSLYLGLGEISRTEDGGFALDGPGEALEPVLVMRRFDQDALLSRRAEAGVLGETEIERFARDMAALHARAPEGPREGGAARLRSVFDGAAGRLRAPTGALEAGLVRAALEAVSARLDQAARVLDARAARGCVRRCHGDLHLENIVRLDGRAVAFDALEFDETLATVDIAYDAAFLLMDLLHRGLKPHASRALNGWMDGCDAQDLDALAVLPCAIAIRALVRAMTAADRAGPGDTKDAEAHLTLARRLAAEPPRPRLVAVGGLSGSGKSTLARRLAPALPGPAGALVLRSDVERKAMLGADPFERLPETAYAAEVNARVAARLADKAVRALDHGGAVIVDAVHARAAERDALEAVARRAQASFDGLWLSASDERLRDRIAARKGDASDATVAVLERQLARGAEKPAWPEINASAGAEDTFEAACRLLGLPRNAG